MGLVPRAFTGKKPHRCALSRPTPGDCMTCTGTCGSGAWIHGTTTIKGLQAMAVIGSQKGLKKRDGCCAAAPGASIRGTADRPPGTGGSRTAASTLSVSASVFPPQDFLLEPWGPQALGPQVFLPLVVGAAGAWIFFHRAWGGHGSLGRRFTAWIHTHPILPQNPLHNGEKALNIVLNLLAIQAKRLWIRVIPELNRKDGELSQGL